MFENIAAIDIGSSSIKIVLIRTGLKDFQVKSFIHENIEIESENVNEAVSEALSRFVNDTDLEDYTFLTNLPMEKTIIRDLTFPFKDSSKISEAIPFEAEENIPFNLEDVIIDFQPIKSKDDSQARVLLAAATKQSILESIGLFEGLNIKPVMMGLESQALFECYKYFNKIEEETVIQLHIGYTKSILNTIHNNELLFTRSIQIGLKQIYEEIAAIKKIPLADAAKLLEDLRLDLSSYDNNIQKEYYKENNISKAVLKNMYTKASDIIYQLAEQITLTQRAFSFNIDDYEINRILISGGAANVHGIATIISNEFTLPVVSLPFLEDNKEPGIHTLFPIAFGTILTYLNKKEPAINLLKDEFLPEVVSSSRRKYYLTASFLILTIIILIINLISTSYLKSKSNEKYNEILNDKLKKYFHAREISGDPIKEAVKFLNDEKKELDGITNLIKSDNKMLDILKDILSNFPQDENFELKNIVINETIIKINGNVGTSKNIDDFKNKLIESNMYDNVTLNTNIRKEKVRFSMNIKFKLDKNTNKDKKMKK